MVTSTLNKKILEVVTMQVFRSGVFDRSEKKYVGGLKTAWEIGGIETEQGRMVLQRWFNSSVVGSKILGCFQVGVRKTSPVGLDQKLVIVCKMASKKSLIQNFLCQNKRPVTFSIKIFYVK